MRGLPSWWRIDTNNNALHRNEVQVIAPYFREWVCYSVSKSGTGRRWLFIDNNKFRRFPSEWEMIAIGNEFKSKEAIDEIFASAFVFSSPAAGLDIVNAAYKSMGIVQLRDGYEDYIVDIRELRHFLWMEMSGNRHGKS